METKLNDQSTWIKSTNNFQTPEFDQRKYNGTNGDCCTSTYYGVYIPCDNQNDENASAANVFEDKSEALKLVKKNKKARFKVFNFYHEAVDFATNGAEVQNNNNNAQNVSENPSPVGEKPSPYRGPKSQDLVILRRAIESGNVDSVKQTIWDNPRYLVSVGDTPSILQVKPNSFINSYNSYE